MPLIELFWVKNKLLRLKPTTSTTTAPPHRATMTPSQKHSMLWGLTEWGL